MIKNILFIVNIFFLGCLIGCFFGITLSIDSRNNFTAPSNYLNLTDIHILEDKVCLDLENVTISSYANTGSMKPIIDGNSNGIRIKITNKTQINVGDLITYSTQKCINEFCTLENLIVHQVKKIGVDENGIYYILRGTNNRYNDEKIRFDQIKYKTIAIIY